MELTDALAVYEKYYSNSLHGQMNRISRSYHYVIEKENKEDQTVRITTIASSAILFGGLGLKGGAFVAGPPGATVGGVTGLGVGIGIGVYLNVKAAEGKADYVGWAKEKIQEDVFSAAKELFDKDQILSSSCVCPLKADIVEIAMVAPDGRLYDLEELKRWVPKAPKDTFGNFQSPVNRDHYYSLIECQPMPQLDLFIQKRIYFLLGQHIETVRKHTDRTSHEICAAIAEIRDKFPAIIEASYDRSFKQIQELYAGGVLDDDGFIKATKHFYSMFGKTYNANVFQEKSKEELETLYTYISSGPRPQSFSSKVSILKGAMPYSHFPPETVMYKYCP
jgi:hypothetical protein